MEQNEITSIGHHPVMTLEQFATRAGLSTPSVRAMVLNGDIPSVKIGKRRMVNVVQLVRDLMAAGEGE